MSNTILIYRLGSIGDTVIALPCFHRIANSYPNSNRIVLTNRPVSTKAAPLASVLVGSGLIHGTIDYELGERRISAFTELGRKIRSLNVKTVIYLTEPRSRISVIRDLMFFVCCGAMEIIGAPLVNNRYHLKFDRSTGQVEREAERLARCLSALGPIDLSNHGAWDLRLTHNEKRRALRELHLLQSRKIAAIHLGGKVRKKDWGDLNWITLLENLWIKLPEFGLAFFGATEERERSDIIAQAWPGEVVNLCGRISPRESAAAMQQAQIFIGHDSGPMHLASSVGTPCVGIFGDYNLPQKWHPIGNQHRSIHSMRGISVIPPEDVCQAVYDILGLR